MLDKILYVNIDYKDGLYKFENASVFPQIPENMKVNVPFFYEENSFDELVEVITEEDEANIVFSCSKDNYLLVKALGDILAAEYDRNIYLVSPDFKKEYRVKKKDSPVYLLRDYKQLNQLPDILFEELEEEEAVFSENGRSNLEPGCHNAMKNGYIAFMTGIYPENLSNTLAKHILVNEKEELENLNDYLDVNGALLVRNSTNEAKDAIQHIHLVKEDELCIDCSQDSVKQVICSYSQFDEWKKEKKINEDICYFLKITRREDLECFARDLEIYKKEGLIDTFEKRIVDECRFSGECSLKRITRYEVSDGMVKPCLTSNTLLGDVYADCYTQKTEANRLCDKTMIQRKCMQCSLKNICAKCSCVSAEMTSSGYCDFMHKYPFVREYLKKCQVAAFLGRYSSICKGDEYVRFSSSTKGLVYPVNAKKPENAKSLFIFEKGGMYYYLDICKGTLVRMEEKYVFLLEAWAMGEGKEAMVENMQVEFSLSKEQAEAVVDEGNQRLRCGGMIDK